MNSAPALLHGYRALDLTDSRGQLCGRFLADLGMEVIKIEPAGGDPVRNIRPIKDLDGASLSLPFAHLNAGKASTILDLRHSDGRGTFLGLVKNADVVLESFSPGVMSSLGVDYKELASVNPRIVMASITGFGQTGRHRHYAY